LAGSDCAARAAPKMSSHSARSRRIFADLQSSLLDRRRQQSRVLRNQCLMPLPLIKRTAAPNGRMTRDRLKRPQLRPHDKNRGLLQQNRPSADIGPGEHRSAERCRESRHRTGISQRVIAVNHVGNGNDRRAMDFGLSIIK
jgi:hypothetical protein